MRLHTFKTDTELYRRKVNRAKTEASHELQANIGWTKSKTHQLLNQK